MFSIIIVAEDEKGEAMRVSVYNFNGVLNSEKLKKEVIFKIYNPYLKMAGDGLVIIRVDDSQAIIFNTDIPKSLNSEELKLLGNDKMAKRNYDSAIEFYTSAIMKDETNPIFFSNRVLAFLELELYDNVIEDSNKAISLEKKFRS